MIKPLLRSTSVGSAFHNGLEIYKENFGLVFLAYLVAMLISGISCGICGGPMFCGVIGVFLALLRKQEPKPEFGGIFDGFQKFAPSFVSLLVFGIINIIIFGLGWLIMLISGFIPILGFFIWIFVVVVMVILLNIIGMLANWALFLVQDQEATIGEAISTPFKVLGDGKFWSFILVSIVAGLVGFAGIIACGIGMLFTMPLAFCIITAAYEEICQDEPTQNAPISTPVETPVAPAVSSEPPTM